MGKQCVLSGPTTPQIQALTAECLPLKKTKYAQPYKRAESGFEKPKYSTNVLMTSRKLCYVVKPANLFD